MTARQIILLVLRVTLAVAFLYFGFRKLISHPVDIEIYRAIGFGQWPRFVTGTVEITCALFLLWPPATRLAALGLVATMAAGTAALMLFTVLPFWHLPVLGALAVATLFLASPRPA